MRFYGLALAMSALVLGACGGGDDAATTDTATTATPGAAAPAGAPAAGAAAAAAAVTGQVHEVKMVGDAQGFRFEPANLTIKQGDGVKFTMVSGGPHNVSFENVPDAAKAQLDANIPAAEKMSELQTRYYQNAGEEVTISFANVPAGAYNIVCVPHAAMNMRGVITVQ
jgi:plastocyanin